MYIFTSHHIFFYVFIFAGYLAIVRSKPTKGGHTNQCTYDIDRNLIGFQRPAVGIADYKACVSWDYWREGQPHYEHDMRTYNLAEKLRRVDDYYSVRPTLY